MKSALELIELSGSPREIGRQWGEALQYKLRTALEQNLATISGFHGVEREAVLALALKYLPAAEAFDPEHMELLHGQAEGSGLSFSEVFFLRCALEITLYFKGLAGLCTSFAVTGRATRDGKTILGQNVDWFPDTPLSLLKVKHADGLEQLIIHVGICEYTLNSTGFGVCANLTCTPPQGLGFGLPVFCCMPRVMRQPTLAHALGLMCQATRGTGYFHLASADGAMFGFESTFDDFKVLLPQNDVLAHSNHYLCERFEKGDWGHLIFPDTYLRAHRMRQLIDQNYGQLTPSLMMRLLADHQGHPTSICRHPDPSVPAGYSSVSLASFIMEPQERVLHLCLGNPCANEYVSYSL